MPGASLPARAEAWLGHLIEVPAAALVVGEVAVLLAGVVMVFTEESTTAGFLLRARREGIRDFGACMTVTASAARPWHRGSKAG